MLKGPVGFRYQLKHDAWDLYAVASSASRRLVDADCLSARHPDALTAVVFSWLAVEGVANELIECRRQAERAETVRSTELERVSLFDEEHLKTIPKLRLMFSLISGLKSDLGTQPLQDLEILKQIRNALVHKKATVAIEEMDGNKPFTGEALQWPMHTLERHLSGLNILAPQESNGGLVFTDRIATPASANWALGVFSRTISWLDGSIDQSIRENFLLSTALQFYVHRLKESSRAGL